MMPLLHMYGHTWAVELVYQAVRARMRGPSRWCLGPGKDAAFALAAWSDHCVRSALPDSCPSMMEHCGFPWLCKRASSRQSALLLQR